MDFSIKLKKIFKSKYINLIFFALIIICWIPTILAFFPGISNYDGRYQLYTFFTNTVTSHHPIIHTLLLSFLYSFGSSIFNYPSLGFVINTLFQVIVMASIFSFVTKNVYIKTKNLALTVITLLFFSLFPLNAIFPLMTTKDVLFAGLVLLYVVLFFKVSDKSNFSNLDFIKLGIVTVLMLLFRNNAIYAFIPAILVCVFFRNKIFKHKFIISTFIAIVLYFLLSSILILITNAESGSPKEKMSIITQSIARVVKYHSDTLQSEEIEKIDYYFGNAQTLADSYMPSLSDKTKDLLQYDKVESSKKDFYSMYFNFLKKYPKTCIDSFLENCRGYWDIFDNSFALIGNNEYPTSKGYLEITFYKLTNDDYTLPNLLPGIHNMYVSLFCENNYRYIPILNILFQPAFYFYFLICYLVYAIYKKNTYNLFITIFLMLYFVSCFLGPCSIVRYIYCIIVCIPILISRLTLEFNKTKS